MSGAWISLERSTIEAIVADRLTPERRSANMSRVRNGDTTPERYVRSSLHAAGFRFRKNKRGLPGTPDVVLPRYRTAVFVHGCFWHGHDCSRGKRPSTNAQFWDDKITRNAERDRRAVAELTRLGWFVEVIWTCGLREQTEALVSRLRCRRLKEPDQVA